MPSSACKKKLTTNALACVNNRVKTFFGLAVLLNYRLHLLLLYNASQVIVLLTQNVGYLISPHVLYRNYIESYICQYR